MTQQFSTHSWQYPQTVGKAVEELMSLLSPQEIEEIRNASRENLESFQVSLGSWIGHNFGLWHQNQRLISSCKATIGIHQALSLNPDYASEVIIESLWECLQK